MKLDFDDWYWLIFLGVVFLTYEIYAAFSKKKGDTLSENVWDWFAIKKVDAPYGPFRRFVLMGFMTSLTSHFVYATPVGYVIAFGVGVVWSILYYYLVERVIVPRIRK